MRNKLLVLLLVAGVAACAEDATSPEPDVQLFEDAAVLAYGSMDMAYPGDRFFAKLQSLPDRIALTPQQVEAIRALVQAFQEATAEDKAALAAIHEEARAAKQAGATPEEIRAILAQGHEIRARLHEAERQLHADILALLTPEQVAWLARHSDRFCSPENVRLTEDQKTQITALVVAFELEHREDLQAIKEVFQEAREAWRNGASREEIRAILEQAHEPMQHIREAQAALEAAIRALLTPAQLACFGRWRWPH